MASDVSPDTPKTPQRRLATALGSLAGGLLVVSLFFPFWQTQVFAPQYRQGLKATLYAYHIGGDAREIDSLNHYIGISKLESLGQWERRLGFPAVLALAFLSWRLPRAPRASLRWLMFLPVALFPLIFVLDMTIWMRYASRHLNPAAPLKLKPFTIPIIGQGRIAQFHSAAGPMPGFYLAVAAILLLLAALWQLRKEGGS